MKLIRGWRAIVQALPDSVVTIGNFDGVHLGHQSLLQDVVARAKAANLVSVVILFEPHPLEFFLKKSAPARLMKLREKLLALQSYQIDYVLCLRFDARLAAMPAQDFVTELLVKRLSARVLVVGDDFRFGAKRQGDVRLLRELGQRYGYVVDQMPTLLEKAERVSSTRVREALAADDLLLAKQLLGRTYTLTGKVVHGNRIGRQLGFPTANLYLHRQVVAIQGVLVVRVKIAGEAAWHYGVANLGTRPVVGGKRVLLEVYLFDFKRDIYGQHLQVELLHKLRDEVMLPDLAALKTMIAKDVQDAKAWLADELRLI
jgi:riboflavin kinase/FMN adenylyltransferase